HFKIAMDCLGIMHDVVPPFSPEKKGTVERAIGTLQRDIIRLLPGFVGHSVKDRKMIEGRKAFATRLGENAEAVFCVNMRAEEIQDTLSAWCAGTYEKRPHSSLLARRSPHAIYASANFTPRTLDAEALHILLAPIDGNGLRTVTKKGIRIGAASYFGDALIAFVGEQVLVRMNTEDLGKVYCFDPETYDFIGEAQNLELLGAERELLAASAKRKQAAARAQARKHLRKLARPITQSDIVAAALDAGRDYGCIMQRQKLRLQFRIRELRISNLTHEFHDKSLKLFVAKCLRRTNRFLDGFDQAQSLVSHFDDAISRVNQCSQIIEVNHSKLAPDYNSVVKDNS
ncbi:MAG: Mu transposase C-terminal domain-containing protein, partial [Pseudomonadota bacterium]